ncbi:MAG: biotin/lipoyl-binding protein, partial [Candidatus Obscuribacterales bacterium]|nr:biotin/lipoyl-binding protein [Candidatus Obscuribacterales bacterium]
MNQLQVCSVAQIQALVSKAFGRKKVLLIVAVITAVSFAAASVWLCLSSTGATALKVQNISKPVVTVELINPTVVRLRSDITVTGTIAARDSLEVGSEASGLRIEQVYVEEGDTVRRGQMLARLNTSVLEATLHEETALL